MPEPSVSFVAPDGKTYSLRLTRWARRELEEKHGILLNGYGDAFWSPTKAEAILACMLEGHRRVAGGNARPLTADEVATLYESMPHLEVVHHMDAAFTAAFSWKKPGEAAEGASPPA